MSLQLKRFNMNMVKDDSVVVMIGKRNTGKSFLTRDLLYHHQELPAGTVISPTENANKFYSEIVPPIFIHDEYDNKITDEFMKAVEKDEEFGLRSPHNKKIIEKISARALWIKILTARVETGEPYILFIDSVNRSIPEHHKKLNLNVKTSNLCSEITLPTGLDHLNNERTAVCCLSSLNL